ncbi:tetratricopeptide repeat protein [Mucilaginibacter sp.]|uniref:tetratricopeptide repeat protein n=1 Tax=Mucilaginibacter sp. TaxID=1882438 RepID=UPI00284E8E85|nr:tetratricopeptide repeat protein [Mucilaginibacter sp.]MDR3696117.1 tetratricopeptide repeat protein [Mucilaginibacter sp.]
MIRKFLTLIIFFLTWQLTAKANFSYDANCTDAYKAILDLRMSDARSLIQKEKQQNPQNGIIILLENYVDYFSLLASENKADYERLKDLKSTRLSALEDNDSNSPFYLYSQAEIYLQWSFLKAKFGDYVSSGFDAKKANGLLHDNEEKYPGFVPDQISLALVNVVFGSIPASFKSITRFLGMSGNAQAGVKKLEEIKADLPKTKFAFYNNEVIFFICTIDINVLHNNNDYPRLISMLNEMGSASLLKTYVQGLIASKTAHNDDVIIYLEARPKGGDYVKLPSINYMLGCAKLCRVDNETPTALYDFVNEYRGINYIKDAYLKLGYFYLLKNDIGKYDYFVRQAKTKGYTIDSKDQQALWEANDVKPDIDLLKARFYFDGGYYSKALAQLANKDESDFKLLRDKIEFCYRLGRIYDKTGKYGDAILNYQKAIRLGAATRYYFAANAALSIGKIYEDKKDFKRAGDYYNQALDIHGHQYQTDIDNDAKAGLKRIGQ